MTLEQALLIAVPLALCSCSSLQHVVTSDNVLRAVEIGEHAGKIWKHGREIYRDINEPPVINPTK